MLLEALWKSADYRDPRTIDVHVRHLREKLEAEPRTPEYILTVRGVGYRFRDAMRPFRSVGRPARARAPAGRRRRAGDRLRDRRPVVQDARSRTTSSTRLQTSAPLSGRAAEVPDRVRTSSSSTRTTLAPRVERARRRASTSQNETPALLDPYADSNLEGDSTDVGQRPGRLRRDPVADAGARHRDAAAARSRPRSPIRSAPVGRDALLAAARPAAGRRRRAQAGLRSPARSRRCSRCSSATRAPGCSRGASAGSRAPPSGSRPGTSTSPSSTTARTSSASSRAHSSACACGSRTSTGPAASSSPTPRTSCARRSSRSAGSSSCSRSPELDARDPRGVPRLDARAGGAADEARDRPARPLPARRGPADAGRPSRSSSPSSPSRAGGRVPRRAAATGMRSTSRTAPGRGRAATPSACSRSAGSWSRTRSCTRLPGRQVRVSPPRSTAHRALLTVADDGPGIPARGAAAGVRALLPPRRRPRLGQRPRARDRPRARGGDGRPDRALDSQNGWTLFTLVAARRGSRSRTKRENGANGRLTLKNAARRRTRRTVAARCASSPTAALALLAAVLGGAVVRSSVAMAPAACTSERRRSSCASRRAAGDAAAPVIVAKPLARQRLPAGPDLRAPRRRGRDDRLVLRRRHLPDARAGQGSGFVVSPDRHRAHERPRRHDRRPGRRQDDDRAHRLRRVLGRRPGDRRRSSATTSSTTSACSGSTRSSTRCDPVPLGDSSRVVVGAARGGDREPVREHRLALGRGRLGDPALDPVADLEATTCRRDPDRRADQPRQLRRPALRRPRPRDRDQRPDPLVERQTRASRASASPSRSTRPAARWPSSCRRAPSGTRTSGSRPRT